MLAVSHSSLVVHAITRTQDWLLVMLSFHPLLTMKQPLQTAAKAAAASGLDSGNASILSKREGSG